MLYRALTLLPCALALLVFSSSFRDTVAIVVFVAVAAAANAAAPDAAAAAAPGAGVAIFLAAGG